MVNGLIGIAKFIGASFGFSLIWFFLMVIIAIIRGERITVEYKNSIPVGVLLAICYFALKYSL